MLLYDLADHNDQGGQPGALISDTLATKLPWNLGNNIWLWPRGIYEVIE